MGLPDINFENIRPYDGSRHSGFEELCSQLASLEPSSESKFYRKGRGADAGVECYLQQSDGTEVGWQAKYLFTWDSSLVSQLDESIRTALNKHPKLVEYIVCLPFDLSDSRIEGRKTAREKWEGWCKKWKKSASDDERDLTITLWGKSELAGRLANSNPVFSGRVLYWFGTEAFTSNWFVEQFEKARAALGARYTPDTNVELPVRQDFLAFARDSELQKQIDRWYFRIAEDGHSAVKAVSSLSTEDFPDIHSDALAKSLSELSILFDTGPIEPDQAYPLDSWKLWANQYRSLATDTLDWVYGLPDSNQESRVTEPKRYAQHILYKLIDGLSNIENAVESTRWQLANHHAVLLIGPAGIGKSHLLADVVESQTHNEYPALLILGSTFADGEPWRQILNQLDRPPTEQVKHFLGGLDAAAQAVGTKAIICIDALNERNGIDIWPHRLAAFLKDIEAFPHIGVVLSCRSTYVPYVIPDSLGADQLFRVEHEGFGAEGGEAAKVYLDKRGIVRPGAPNLISEFENPLFLKTCCDFLDKEGTSELPRGLRGVSSIFRFYNEAISRSLNMRMKLDPNFEIVPKAISGFANCLASAGNGYLNKEQAVAVFESIHPSGGSLEQSLLSQLESEGLLTIEPIRQSDGSLVEMVRFTFERFSDHEIASLLFHDNLKKDNVFESFQPGGLLYNFVFGSDNYDRAGVIEAMAVQLPEQADVEILDVGGKGETLWVVEQAFKESLLWREQSKFTNRTFELVKSLLSHSEICDLLISISSEPLNEFNARYVHDHLMKMSMPERDASWSVDLAMNGYESQVETLISWALHNGQEQIDKDRAHLAATMLTWFLAATHRPLRDKATKGLACILSRRLSLAVRLLNEFASVNDPYVFERLLAACYGAALQGSEYGLRELAQTVFDLVFADGTPPADALLRDHAHGIIEYALWRGKLPDTLDISLTKPPYSSPWPIEHVPDELIESYTEVHESGSFRDAIVGSTVNAGDFAVKLMDHIVDNWSPSPLGTTPLPSSQAICESWVEEFTLSASKEQLDALTEFTRASEGAKGLQSYEKTEETKRLESAETALKAALSLDQWEEFRVYAKDFIRHLLFSDWYQDRPATFNVAWCRRWVCMRAHEFGWTTELFREFEKHFVRYGRHEHTVERIGKKYQWLALRELLARMADNLAYVGESWERAGEVPVYRGARQLGLRDIDPSLLTQETHYDGWAEWGETWWVPFNPLLRAVSPHERRAWLESDNDIINDASLIDLRNPKTGRNWLALWSFSDWKSWGMSDGSKEMQRDTWFRLNCYVVHRTDQVSLIEALKNKVLIDSHALPCIDLHREFYLGEYPWHPELQDVGPWSLPTEDWWASAPVPTRATVASYTCERGGYDYSIDRTVSVNIPAPWMSEAMGLRLSSGKSPVYVDDSEQLIFYDPSVIEAGPAAALVDRDAFLQMLSRENLAAVWVIAGEKGAYGGRRHENGFGGRVLHTGIYQLDGEGFLQIFHKDWEHPSDDQLKEFLAEED